jgi:hypothetical protein
MNIIPRRILASLIASALVACASQKNQSPFESHGLRAGMRFSDLDHRTSERGGEWKRENLMMGIVHFERTQQPIGDNPRAARIIATVDTADNRVLEVTYAPIDIPADTAAFTKEMADVASEWDKITGGVRDQTGQPPGPYFIQWTSPDSVWTGTINYFGSPRGTGGKPDSFEIKERKWEDRQLLLLDSLKSAGKLR